MHEVVKRLKAFTLQQNENFDIVMDQIEDDLNDVRNSLNGELSLFIRNFDEILTEDLENIPTSSNIIHEDLFKKLTDEIVELIFKEINEEKHHEIRTQHILDKLKNNNITLQEIYIWVLNNQKESNCIFLFGYFNYFGIGTKQNKKKSFNLFNIASE